MSAAARNVDSDSILPKASDRRLFADLMVEIERRIDVNSLRFEDIVLWPLIRWQLARGIKGIESGSAAARRDQVKERLENIGRRAGLALGTSAMGPSSIWRQGLQFARRIFGGTAGRRASVSGESERFALAVRADLARQFDRLRSVGPIEFVVFAKTEKYYQRVGDRRYAPVTDPVFEDLQRFGRALSVALEPLEFECVNPPLRLDIEPHMWLTRRDPMPQVHGLEEWSGRLNETLRAIAPDFHLAPDKLLNRLQRYRRKHAYFREVISILQPRSVFFSSFTGWAPLTWACRQLGVPTVDIQHGGQGPYHYLTTHFTQVPEEGYALLPDYFWCWSSANCDFIAPWLPGRARRHIALVGGNRNVAKWLRAGNSLLSQDERDYIEMLGLRPKVVLVTLGYAVQNILPDAVVEAARRTPEWSWLFRLHPLHRESGVVAAVQRKLQAAGVVTAEIKMPTQVRLHALLSVVHHHLTPFSTTGREAVAFGVPTTIVDPVGRTYFADEIAQGTFGYAEDAEAIVAALGAGQVARAASKQEYLQYVETDDSLVSRLVDRILQPSARAAGVNTETRIC